MKRYYDRWTPEEAAELQRLRTEEGLGRAALAKHFHRSIQSVEQKLHRLRCVKPRAPVTNCARPAAYRPTPEAIAHYAELVRRGINPLTASMIVNRRRV